MKFLLYHLLYGIYGKSCPEGWLADPYNDRCYKEFSSKMNWNGAESHCQSFGGDLVSISDEREQKYIVSILSRGSYDYYWIGLNDLVKSGSYEWIKTDKK